MSDPVVRAAGGIVWRRAADGGLEVVVIHRPRYDDWSFPKGKTESGESDEAAALREVEEETRIRGRLGAELPSAAYHDSKGRSKEVRYWAMEPASGELAPATEADDARWVSVPEAERLLSYDRDRTLLQALQETLS